MSQTSMIKFLKRKEPSSGPEIQANEGRHITKKACLNSRSSSPNEILKMPNSKLIETDIKVNNNNDKETEISSDY